MRIDAHQHFWTYNKADYGWIGDNMQVIARDFGPAHLAAEMDEARIDASIAVQARQSDAETDWLLRLAADNERIAGVVGWIDLRSPNLTGRLAQLADAEKLVGFRHVIQDEPDPEFMCAPDFVRGVKWTLAAGYAYDILIFHHQAPHVPRFLDACGEGRFIVDHIAKPDMAGGEGKSEWARSIREIASFPNVYCKLSGMVTEADWSGWTPETFEPFLDTVLEAFGPDRVMFGSDWPVCLLAGRYGQVYRLVEDYVMRNCADGSAAIFGGNAARAYRT